MREAEGNPRIIDDLYAGTLDEPAWQRALAGIADLVAGAGTILSCVNPATRTILRNEICRWDPEAARIYAAQWVNRDPRVMASFGVPVGVAMYAGRLIPMAEWTASAIYNEYQVPADAPWFMAFVLNRFSTKAVNLCITATRSRGPFDPQDAERLQPLIPHIRRAIEIKDRLEAAQVRSATLAASMDNLSFGVLVLDETGHVLEASVPAMDLLDGVSMRIDPDGTLWLREPAGRQLNQWVMTGIPPAGEADGLLHVRRPDARPLSVTVSRLQAQSPTWFGAGTPGWMLCLFDPDRELPPHTAMIARDLGITARESEIVTLLATGYDARDVASRLGISIHTVRTHLKSVFAATGVRSQGELMLRVLGGPGGSGTAKWRGGEVAGRAP